MQFLTILAETNKKYPAFAVKWASHGNNFQQILDR